MTINAALKFFKERPIRTMIHCGGWKGMATVRECDRLAGESSIHVHGVLGNNDSAIAEARIITFHNVTLYEGVLEQEYAGTWVAIVDVSKMSAKIHYLN